jgi:hypothetical protein
MERIYTIPTTQDNDIITQSGDSLVTQSTVVEIPLFTQNNEALTTQALDLITIREYIGDPYYIVWDDEQNLKKNYTPTINEKVYGN